MSSCRHGGRDAYERPAVREYDQAKPIRGRIVYEDGSESGFTYARFVNGAEREVAHVEIDGEVFLKRYPTKDAANDGGQTF